jgi:hypothetical protein
MKERDDELTLIEKRLSKLPPSKFREIVGVLEESRSDFGSARAVEALMSKMRPRLVRMKLARKLTLQRLFCRPFEELLVDDPEPKGIGTRITRRSIEPCWKLFVDRADARKLQRFAANLRVCSNEETRKIERVGRHLWAYAADVLKGMLRARGGLPDELVAGMSERAYRDILFIADYLQIADVLQELKRKLGRRPLRKATAEHIDAIVTALEAVNAVNREYQHIVIDVMLAWLKHPSDIVAIVDRIAAEAKAEIDENSLALAGEALVEDVEEQLRSVTGLAARSGGERADLVRGLRGCVSDVIGAHGAFQNRASTTAMRRLERIRGKVASLVADHVLKEADTRVLTAVPRSPERGGQPADVSDVLPIVALEALPDPARVQAAEDQAIALRLCVKYAEELGLGPEFFDSVENLGRAIEDRARWAAVRLDVASMTAERRDAAAAHFYVAIRVLERVLELVAGSDRADNLRRQLMGRFSPPANPAA